MLSISNYTHDFIDTFGHLFHNNSSQLQSLPGLFIYQITYDENIEEQVS